MDELEELHAEERPLTVSEVTFYIKRLLERDELLQFVIVRGEISNFRRHRSGHVYFTLKDEEAALECVCFRNVASKLNFDPEDGMAVVAGGRISVYAKQGRYQLVVLFMRQDGLGALWQEFERLKAKLEAEGLFDESRKRPLPRFPRCIALVTSPTGAAIRDLVSIITRRYPLVKLLIIPTLVQGEGAPESIVASLQIANSIDEVDLIIVGRGGGSIEDLWAFNDERVARAIFASRKPTISAVGHERDWTIADYVADVRAATPSAAAEIAVPDRRDLLRHLDSLAVRAATALGRLLHRLSGRLAAAAARRPLSRPDSILDEYRLHLAAVTDAAERAIAERIAAARARLARAHASALAHRPDRLLARARQRLAVATQRLQAAAARTIQQRWARVQIAWAVAVRHRPEAVLARARARLAQLLPRMAASGRRAISGKRAELAHALRRLATSGRTLTRPARARLDRAAAQLAALDPKAVLQRGYSVTFKLPQRRAVRSRGEVQPGDRLQILVSDGEFPARAGDEDAA